MQKWKARMKSILYPGKVLTWLIPAVSLPLLALVFYLGWEQTPLAYPCYVLAFYSLVLLTLGMTVYGAKQKKLAQHILE